MPSAEAAGNLPTRARRAERCSLELPHPLWKATAVDSHMIGGDAEEVGAPTPSRRRHATLLVRGGASLSGGNAAASTSGATAGAGAVECNSSHKLTNT